MYPDVRRLGSSLRTLLLSFVKYVGSITPPELFSGKLVAGMLMAESLKVRIVLINFAKET
jgi:hypothetical protein